MCVYFKCFENLPPTTQNLPPIDKIDNSDYIDPCESSESRTVEKYRRDSENELSKDDAIFGAYFAHTEIQPKNNACPIRCISEFG